MLQISGSKCLGTVFFFLHFQQHKFFKSTISRVYHKVKCRFSPVSCFYTTMLTDVLELLYSRYYSGDLALEADCLGLNPNSASYRLCDLEQIK